MNSEQGSNASDPAHFRTTRWSAILVAAASRMPGSQAALSELCRLYWFPLYAFARRRGYAPHDAQDLTQGFFLHLLERRSLKRADPLKGKFRSFLLASFQNFLADQADKARSLKRGGNREFIFLDAQDVENRCGLEAADHLTAENIYDARWAMTLLSSAVDQLREECAARGETCRFEVLGAFVGVAQGQPPPSCEEVAESLGIGIGTAKTLIHRFRKRYSAILRETIARTVTDPAEIEEEVRALCQALAIAEGRI